MDPSRYEHERSEFLACPAPSSEPEDAQCQGYADRGISRRRPPRNLDEIRHQQRCRDTDCAEHDHQAYRDEHEQRYVPPVEPGDSDWSVVWGYTHIEGPPRRRLPGGPPWTGR